VATTAEREVMNSHDSIAKESPRRRIAQRVGAAGMILAPLLMLTACHEAQGGGYIGDPVPGGVIPVNPLDNYQTDANFGFNFQCDDGVKGQITYHDGPSTIESELGDLQTFPEITLHGTVEKVFIEVIDDPTTPNDETGVVLAKSCEDIVHAPGAHFEGSYRPQNDVPGIPDNMQNGRFNVGVFDQREPGRSLAEGDINGDGFAIQLDGGAYTGYTRGGYIEGGNIQAD
jgi:hypothetical protein